MRAVLFARCTLLTPNLAEASLLTGLAIGDVPSMRAALPALVALVLDEESVRVRTKIAEGLLFLGWEIGDDDRDACASPSDRGRDRCEPELRRGVPVDQRCGDDRERHRQPG